MEVCTYEPDGQTPIYREEYYVKYSRVVQIAQQ